ncbi:unnamed protein product [Protopolystoma xenopodis]|uniref:Uncharacterized protein n=1 Tax=Protopolystoma xenopodis TaxID=117903 RepID=A0A3S5BAH1_9PLAT|nr:unnamed protein product [Protopolystoma xenopodis]
MLSKDPGSPTVNSWASWPVQTNKNSIGNELNSVFSKATRATNFRPASIFPKANKRPLYRLHSVNASRTASLCLAYRSESVPESLSELEVTSGLSSGPISDQESRASFWCVDADNDSSGSALISYFTALRMILTFRPYLLLMGTFMFLSLGLQASGFVWLFV